MKIWIYAHSEEAASDIQRLAGGSVDVIGVSVALIPPPFPPLGEGGAGSVFHPIPRRDRVTGRANAIHRPRLNNRRRPAAAMRKGRPGGLGG